MPEENAYTPTAEEIARHYSAALDSVSLVNGDKPEGQSDADWKDTLERNVGHLSHMLTQTYWTTEDLTPFSDAVAAGNAKIAAIG